MMNLLAPLCTGIAQNAITPVWIRLAPFLQGKSGRQHHHTSQQRGMLGANVRHGRNMHFRNHEEMHWRPRVDIVEHKYFLVLVKQLGRDFARHNFAEQAVRRVLNNRVLHGAKSMASPLFMWTMPLTIR